MGRPKWAQDQRQALRPRQGCPRLPPRSSLARGVRWRQRGDVRVRPGRAAVCHASCHTVAVSPPAANSVLGEVVQAYVSSPLLVKPQSVCQAELSLIRRSRPNRPALRRCQLETSVTRSLLIFISRTLLYGRALLSAHLFIHCFASVWLQRFLFSFIGCNPLLPLLGFLLE